MTSTQGWLLFPVPRSVEETGHIFSLPQDMLIVINAPRAADVRFTAHRLQAALATHAGVHWEVVASTAVPREQMGAVLSVVPGAVRHPQGYELTITEQGIHVVADAPAGVFYAVMTLTQILQQRGRTLPTVRIRDWPDFPNRGVMLDISRDKVPTMETLYALVDLLASFKVNQFQLYTEHTFAYRNHPTVWAEASPLTGEEILALDAYCRERFIELVPNQNTFGHMRRWLVHDEYRDLAECPEGCDTRWGYFDEPFSLNPLDPRSLDLVRDLLDELLPHFSSRQVNVGCDETVDLGRGRSKEAVEKYGEGRVYLDFLLKIYREVKAREHTMMFWGDIIVQHPDLVPELPRDVIALEWGYEADHPFDAHGRIFAASGVPFYVCPGTSTWNAIAGRTENAMGNLRNAAENGLKHGAVGYLNTDWGDNGHWQPLPASFLGFVYGAGVSWTYEASRDADMVAVLNRFVFRDRAGVMGRIAFDLGNAYQVPGVRNFNGSILFRILQWPPERIAEYQGLTEEGLRRALAYIDEVMAALDEEDMDRPDADLIKREFAWAADMLRHGAKRGIWALGKARGEEDVALREELARDAERLMAEYRDLWHARNRPGGFKDSLARMEKMAEDYK
ncbi:MAG: family 20 glycosylhydrolase [Chloroflexi bacterium]|nr:family 20 glycosylhydrolase [Chloroflexota bacterium]